MDLAMWAVQDAAKRVQRFWDRGAKLDSSVTPQPYSSPGVRTIKPENAKA